MTRRNTLICVFFLLYLFFGSNIQARWIHGPPRSLNIGKISEMKNTKEKIPKELPYKSDQEFYESYLRFLQELNLILGACQKWRTKYHVQKEEIKKTTTTIDPLVKNTSSI